MLTLLVLAPHALPPLLRLGVGVDVATVGVGVATKLELPKPVLGDGPSSVCYGMMLNTFVDKDLLFMPIPAPPKKLKAEPEPEPLPLPSALSLHFYQSSALISPCALLSV